MDNLSRYWRSRHVPSALSIPNKRARSPTPASSTPTSPAANSHDGESDKEDPPPALPSFLNTSELEMDAKYRIIALQERIRQDRSQPVPSTRCLDRYSNVHPWANNRVKLQVPPGANDYINASPIVMHSLLPPKPRWELIERSEEEDDNSDGEVRPLYRQVVEPRAPYRYIAMQGPMPETTNHVWRMVTEQLKSPAVIVMLTETSEKGLDKCFHYYPDTPDGDPVEVGEDDEFEDGFRAQVTCKSLETRAGGAIEVREMNIHVEGREEDMTVWHLYYTRWPDFGVPKLEDMGSFFELMHLSREKNASEDNPLVIHCSAGVGRTGTYITLELLMRELESGGLRRYDGELPNTKPDLVFATVSALREQRKMMVQQPGQYRFIYQVLRKKWIEKYGIADDCAGDEPAAKRLEVDHDPFVEE